MSIDVLNRPDVAPLSRIPAGSWRNIWRVYPPVEIVGGMDPLGDGLWVGRGQYPSREIAEEKAAEHRKRIAIYYPSAVGLVVFVEARFFPAGA